MIDFTQVIQLPKNNIKLEKSGLITISSGVARILNTDHLMIYPSKDYSIIIIRPDTTGKGIKVSKSANYSRIRFNSSRLLKNLKKVLPELPDNFKSIKFELSIEEINGKDEIFFTTGKTSTCFVQ